MASASAQLMVTEQFNKSVMLFSEVDGSLSNPTFIDMNAGVGTPAIWPIEALAAPNGEIWISDQNADTIFRYSATGTYLGESSAALDNVRGFEIAYGSVWGANYGTLGGAPGEALVQLDMNLNFAAAFTNVGNPFDVQAFQFGGVNGLLVSDVTNDTLHCFDPANPSNLVVFHSSVGFPAGFQFAQQITVNSSDGNVRITSLRLHDGLFEFDKSNGAQIEHVDIFALFGQFSAKAAFE